MVDDRLIVNNSVPVCGESVGFYARDGITQLFVNSDFFSLRIVLYWS